MISIILFIYVSCFIYNNIIINADDSTYFMFLEEENSFLFMYLVCIPIASILFTIYWIKLDKN